MATNSVVFLRILGCDAVTQHRTPLRFYRRATPCANGRRESIRVDPSPPDRSAAAALASMTDSQGRLRETPQPPHPRPSSSLPRARGLTTRWTEPGSRLSRKVDCLKTQTTPPSHTCFPITLASLIIAMKTQITPPHPSSPTCFPTPRSRCLSPATHRSGCAVQPAGAGRPGR